MSGCVCVCGQMTKQQAGTLSLFVFPLPFLLINTEHVAPPMMQHTEDHSTELRGWDVASKGRKELNEERGKESGRARDKCVRLVCACALIVFLKAGHCSSELAPASFEITHALWIRCDGKMGLNSSKSEVKYPLLHIQF